MTMAKKPMRSDTERNRRSLIQAAVKLSSGNDEPVNMTEVAKAAEVSPATAYRQFSSVDHILGEYRFEVGCRMRDYARTLDTVGLERLEELCRCWVGLVVEHGEAMVATRSRHGYLERLREDTYYLTVQAEALLEPLQQSARELGIADIGDEALFLWNLLFDPREIFDLLNTVGLSAEQVGTQLFAALRGALTGWAAARGEQDLSRSWSNGVRT
ncbi:TetR/AcrR family transcriptional regulator [Rhodococcus sp. NPDC059968]|uniref:TetR/AcrR family transcriptional regulator n=1 Tax=Rhodococcus sp. NPDC059968 TaxID=3347017 RepID=UPI00367283BD